jgi:hypothetical protein
MEGNNIKRHKKIFQRVEEIYETFCEKYK